MAQFTLRVDPERCQGHNRCYIISRELFDIDDEGFASVTQAHPSDGELQKKAHLAASNCPERAISAEEE